MTEKKSASGAIPERLIKAVATRLAANKRVRRSLQPWGRLHIDRQLPFLVVYRRPPAKAVEDMHRLVTSEAAYLFAPGDRSMQPSLSGLISRLAATLSNVFGGFLIVEISSGAFESNGSELEAHRPAFRVVTPRKRSLEDLEEKFEDALSKITVRKRTSTIEIVRRDNPGPKGLPRLMAVSDAELLDTIYVGIEVKPIHMDPRSRTVFPLVLRELEQQLTRALRQVFFQFANTYTTHRPRHYHGLGRRSFVKAVWEVDQKLAQISSSFDFLLQVTPINAASAWRRFLQNKYNSTPRFRYRPLPIDPVQVMRKLYAIPIDRLEDPALRGLFREKQLELGRRLSMLLDLNTTRFLYGSLQLYGEVSAHLVHLAESLIESLPRRRRKSREKKLTPAEFAERAESELAFYRREWPELKASVQIRDDTTGLMVSRGSLLISRQSRIPESRVNALIQHEVGTHLVTYYNGKNQPFRQLASGLAGYEALQEGLAVFAEYLAGGLGADRVRLLAARVLAVKQMIDGASFVNVYHRLVDDFDLDRRSAFTAVMRVFRGGGLTKDAVYLQGLVELLDYLKDGGAYDSLLIGKMAAAHVPIIEELRWREVLRPVMLRPRYLDDLGAEEKLDAARNGMEVITMVQEVESS